MRPLPNFSSEIHGFCSIDVGWNMGLQQYGPIYKRHRHAINEHFRPSTISKYRPIVRREVQDFLRRLLSTPEDFKQNAKLLVGSHFPLSSLLLIMAYPRRSFASGILDISYGLHVTSLDHPQVERSEFLMRSVSDAATTGKWLVDFIPFLKYVPSWLPGAHFKRMAERTSKMKDDLRNEPFDGMVAQLVSLLHLLSLIHSFINSIAIAFWGRERVYGSRDVSEPSC